MLEFQGKNSTQSLHQHRGDSGNLGDLLIDYEALSIKRSLKFDRYERDHGLEGNKTSLFHVAVVATNQKECDSSSFFIFISFIWRGRVYQGPKGSWDIIAQSVRFDR